MQDIHRARKKWRGPKPGSVIRARFMLIPGIIYCFGYLAFLAFVLACFPKWSKKNRTPLIRYWGRGLLKIFGVKLEVYGQEHRDATGPKILLANHVSLIDLFIYSGQWADPGSVMYKKEFAKIPLFGFIMPRLGFIAVDRGNRERAQNSMSKAAERINKDGIAIWIAPEGTRSRGKGLGNFKMGAFHIALETKAPIVPSVMQGLELLNPGGGLLLKSGTVRIDYLRPIETKTWDRKNLREKSNQIRNQFLQYLEPSNGTKKYNSDLEQL